MLKLSLIVCTYKRPESIVTLLDSVDSQEVYPDEIIVVDASFDSDTETVLTDKNYKNLHYFRVDDENRGLTKQRNFGIFKVSNSTDIVCFLDDDTVLDQSYFKNLIETYQNDSTIDGVGGYILNAAHWSFKGEDYIPSFNEFYLDGWVRKLGERYTLRKRLGLLPDTPPCIMPSFSNGYSVGFLPPSDKTYDVDYFMGCSFSFKKEVVNTIKFSTYFEGYGLYEDMDYCLRVSKKHKLVVDTSVKLNHYHDSSGRPNLYKYGKMVARNGWYVWRVHNANPNFSARIKWNLTFLVLTLVKVKSIFNPKKSVIAITEIVGRFAGLLSLINRPKIQE